MNTGISKGLVGFGAGQSWAILYDENFPPTAVTGRAVVNKAGNESNYGTLPAGVVGAGAGQSWALLYGKNPHVPYMPPQIPGVTESEDGYLSKGVVGAGAGQSWALVYDGHPPKMDESGLLGPLAGLAGLAVYRRSFCNRYIKSLGYLRREKIGGNKIAYIQAINECMHNFKNIKKGKYKIKPADNLGAMVDIESLLMESEKETGVSKDDPNLNALGAPTKADIDAATADSMRSSAARSNMVLYGVIALVVIIIIAMIIYFRNKNKKSAA